MASVTASKGSFSVTAFVGDFKTLLTFNMDKASAVGLAGFTIQCQPTNQAAYYLFNELQYQTPGDHAQDPKEPPKSSINAPIFKFRWLHVPGTVHQGLDPATGSYTYVVTPRYLNGQGELLPLDGTRSVSVKVAVQPFQKAGVELGFTRGYTQSQGFVGHFGQHAIVRPKELQFDTSQDAGKNAQGQSYTYLDEYAWAGFTAREKVFAVLDEVLKDSTLSIDVCAYDLNEPDVIAILLELGKQGRIRILLDNASLHHNVKTPKPEDQFETLFRKASGKKDQILRGKFGSYAHDKVFIVSKGASPATKMPTKVLSGSTNFSVTGMYVNANHTIIFNDPKVAAEYLAMFNEAWTDGASQKKFAATKLAAAPFSFKSQATPQTEISFAPHPESVATSILGGIAKRIKQEGQKAKKSGSVLFAAMQMTGGASPVFSALAALHKQEDIFSYGISDSPSGIYLYKRGTKNGVLVTGKPGVSMLPAPFNQVPGVSGHEIHHKFVVCNFNGPDAVVYFGSSNMFTNPEQKNGDNLIAMHDTDVATAFAIEALALVDHYDFLDQYSKKKSSNTKTKSKKRPTKLPANKSQAALDAQWFLPTNDKWTKSYFDPSDLHYVERILFSQG